MLQNLTGSKPLQQFKLEILAKLFFLGLSSQEAPAIQQLWIFLEAGCSATNASGKRKAAAKLMHLLAAEIGVPRAKCFVAWLAEHRKQEGPITIDDAESVDDAKDQNVTRDAATNQPSSSSARVPGVELFDPEEPVRLEVDSASTTLDNHRQGKTHADVRAKSYCNEINPTHQSKSLKPKPETRTRHQSQRPEPKIKARHQSQRSGPETKPESEPSLRPGPEKQREAKTRASQGQTPAPEAGLGAGEQSQAETGVQSKRPEHEENVAAVLLSLQALAATVEPASVSDTTKEIKQREGKNMGVESEVCALSPDATSVHTPTQCASAEVKPRSMVSACLDSRSRNRTSKTTVVEAGIMHLSRAEVFKHSSEVREQSSVVFTKADMTQVHKASSQASNEADSMHRSHAEVCEHSLETSKGSDLTGRQGVVPPTQHPDQQSQAVLQLNQKIKEASEESASLRAELAAFKKHLAELVCAEVTTVTTPSRPLARSRSRSRRNTRSPSSGSDRSCPPRQVPEALSMGRHANPTSCVSPAMSASPVKMRVNRSRSPVSPAKSASPVKMRMHRSRSCSRSRSPARPRRCTRSRSLSQFRCSQWSELGWAGPGASRRRSDSSSCSPASSSRSSRPRFGARRSSHHSRSRSQSSKERLSKPLLQRRRGAAASCKALLKPREMSPPAAAAAAKDQKQSCGDTLPATSPLGVSAAKEKEHQSNNMDQKQTVGLRRRLSLGGA